MCVACNKKSVTKAEWCWLFLIKQPDWCSVLQFTWIISGCIFEKQIVWLKSSLFCSLPEDVLVQKWTWNLFADGKRNSVNTVQIIYDFNVSRWMNEFKAYTGVSLIKAELRENVLDGRCDISEGPVSAVTICDGLSLWNICFKVNFTVLGMW